MTYQKSWFQLFWEEYNFEKKPDGYVDHGKREELIRSRLKIGNRYFTEHNSYYTVVGINKTFVKVAFRQNGSLGTEYFEISLPKFLFMIRNEHLRRIQDKQPSRSEAWSLRIINLILSLKRWYEKSRRPQNKN